MADTQIVTLFGDVVSGDNWAIRITDDSGVALPTMDITVNKAQGIPAGTHVKLVAKIDKKSIEILDVSIVDEVDEIPGETDPLRGWERVETEYFAPNEIRIFDMATKLLDSQGAFNLFVAGGSGFGKTSRARAWATREQLDLVYVDCALIRDTEELLGYREAVAGDTVFVPTEFAEAFRKGNCIIVLDEVNRVQPWVMNALIPLLDYRRSTQAHSDRLEAGDRVFFVLTANIGYEFVGTFEMDQALRNRVDARIDVSAPPQAVEMAIIQEKMGTGEEDARKIVTTLNQLRATSEVDGVSVDVSTRTALKMAQLLLAGASLREAAQFVIVNNCPEELRKKVVDIINSELGVL